VKADNTSHLSNLVLFSSPIPFLIISRHHGFLSRGFFKKKNLSLRAGEKMGWFIRALPFEKTPKGLQNLICIFLQKRKKDEIVINHFQCHNN
jgi:hypothetical protein